MRITAHTLNVSLGLTGLLNEDNSTYTECFTGANKTLGMKYAIKMQVSRMPLRNILVWFVSCQVQENSSTQALDVCSEGA